MNRYSGFMPNLRSCKTAEDCLRNSEIWLSSPKRNLSEVSSFIEAISHRTGETVELIPCALGIILDEKGEMLLLKRRIDAGSYPDSYSFPGGQLEEHDENLEAAVLRETEQETGLQTKISRHHSTRFAEFNPETHTKYHP